MLKNGKTKHDPAQYPAVNYAVMRRICGRTNRLHYGSCPYVSSSVCLSRFRVATPTAHYTHSAVGTGWPHTCRHKAYSSSCSTPADRYDVSYIQQTTFPGPSTPS